MVILLRALSACFAAGAFGALINSLFVWAAGAFGLSAFMGVGIAPAWTPGWLYQRLVWGGIWGGVFLLPMFKNKVIMRGLVCGLAPSVALLFLFFPKYLGKGLMGQDLGGLTWLFVLAANTVWGVAAAWWLWVVEDQPASSGRLFKRS